MNADLSAYLAHLRETRPDYSFGVDQGRVYTRVWKRLGNATDRSVVVFVGSDGTLYRADSWKKAGRRVGHLSDVAARLGGRSTPAPARRGSQVQAMARILADAGYDDPAMRARQLHRRGFDAQTLEREIKPAGARDSHRRRRHR